MQITSYCLIPLTDPFSGTESAILSGEGRVGNQNCIRFLLQGGNYETTGAISKSYSVNIKHKHTYKSYMTHCSTFNSEHDVGRKKKFLINLNIIGN